MFGQTKCPIDMQIPWHIANEGFAGKFGSEVRHNLIVSFGDEKYRL